MDTALGTAEQLGRIAEIADGELAHADLTTLLETLLGRVQRLLNVDTVAVLLFDPAGRELIAVAAVGLEEEVRQGVRVPFGAGFAGRIAAERAPVILDRVGPDTVVNPLLWSKGIRSMLGVPLMTASGVVGVMHVGTLTDRRFDDDDVGVLQLAADRIALAISAHATIADRDAARTLQRSLLPDRPPAVTGLEFAARLAPAESSGVGGDWYDTFLLPSGHVGIVMGDVAGRGLRAAVVMGRMRSVLRAYALESRSPADVLDRVDHKFTHFEPGEMATVLYVVVDPSLSRFVVSRAGHPPPVMAAPGEDAVVVDVASSPPIGAHPQHPRIDTVIEFPLGAVIGCFTDGLIERRGETIDRGLERIRGVFAAHPVEALCARVMAALVGEVPTDDDVALLAVRRVASGAGTGP